MSTNRHSESPSMMAAAMVIVADRMSGDHFNFHSVL